MFYLSTEIIKIVLSIINNKYNIFENSLVRYMALNLKTENFSILIKCNYKIYMEPLSFFIKIYIFFLNYMVITRIDEYFKVNNLMYFFFEDCEYLDPNIFRFIF